MTGRFGNRQEPERRFLYGHAVGKNIRRPRLKTGADGHLQRTMSPARRVLRPTIIDLATPLRPPPTRGFLGGATLSEHVVELSGQGKVG
jgi:hypothetical protein